MLFFCFLHRLSGGRELPQAGSPLPGGFFSAPADRGTRTALAGSPLTGGEFFAELQRGIRRLRTAGACRAPRQGKRVDTKVSTLLTPTSFYFLVWRRLPTCDRCENRGTAEDFFFRIFRNLFAGSDTLLLHRPATLRRRNILVLRNS